jgi:hypothetical protein
VGSVVLVLFCPLIIGEVPQLKRNSYDYTESPSVPSSSGKSLNALPLYIQVGSVVLVLFCPLIIGEVPQLKRNSYDYTESPSVPSSSGKSLNSGLGTASAGAGCWGWFDATPFGFHRK